MVSKKKTRVVDDVVKNAPLKTKAYAASMLNWLSSSNGWSPKG